MKRALALCLSLVLAMGLLAGCSSNNGGNADGPYKIGVIQLVSHDALDASYQGFVDGLAEQGLEEGTDYVLDFKNAQGDSSNCATIASKLVNDGNDLILAIATDAAIAVKNATDDIPILITAVTDAADSNLVASNEAPGGNLTGTSDFTPVKEQMDLLVELLPEAKKVGFLYNSSETNSEFQVNMAREAAVALGLETEDFKVSNSNELQSVVTSMVGKVDVIYTPTDNMIAEAMVTVSAIATENDIPVIVGEESMVKNGGLASVSISYYELGRITAEMAVEILKDGKNPGDMPIRYQTEFSNEFNDDTAAALGITIPDSLR